MFHEFFPFLSHPPQPLPSPPPPKARGRRTVTGYLLARATRALPSDEAEREDEPQAASPLLSYASTLASALDDDDGAGVEAHAEPKHSRLLYFEFHVLFSPAYSVPELFFTVTSTGERWG